jgi:UDP-N-acetylglucosamine 2-epimerase (non-hydrolysing)/UDP-GlcNAc3NAcA epimerase
VLTVVGNRPQFVKAAAVSRLLRESHEEILVNTGQHHDDELSEVFFQELDVPRPERELHISGGGNSAQTSRMLAAIAPLVEEVSPDAVLVYGDTNSTLAGGLAGAQAQVPVAHVEAGMRSFDRRMPEELNRVLTDHLSSLLLCSSAAAVEQLEREHVIGRPVCVGDVMTDVALLFGERCKADQGPLAEAGVMTGAYLLATAHRAGNVDDPVRLRALVDLLIGVGEPVVLPLHPRTELRLAEQGWLSELQDAANVTVLPPLGYLAFTSLLRNARAVLTDSGGAQKEAYLAGVPCVTLRENTEWTETVDSGWNTLVDLDLAAARTALDAPPPSDRPQLYGDGQAGVRVVAELERLIG